MMYLTWESLNRAAAEANRVICELVPDATGACVAASYTFAHVLSWHGESPEVYGGHYDHASHWWVEVAGFRVDATVTQFDRDAPLVTRVEELTPHGLYDPLEAGEDPTEWAAWEDVALHWWHVGGFELGRRVFQVVTHGLTGTMPPQLPLFPWPIEDLEISPARG